MNQAIQFVDREWWDDTKQAVCFPAMVNGFQIICAISERSLILRFGNTDDALNCFRLNRLDLEDVAEQAIENEEEDDQGWIWLS
ncbi:DUF1488 domain-containing protein [Erwinia sp. 9145]|uniref:DUF1488 domain-containing protein n=1 Tax=Erwinia sp. 9145 TaxID=1500895 RepID=UPI00055369C4|nr:DUF1488 domain-containing protein [Erwinia sp. 9145]